MKARLTKLIDVKTIVTFTLTATFTYLSVRGKIEPQIFMTIYTMVIGFYFGIQHEKHKGGDNNAN
jgi:hypothetical protein